MNLFTVIIVNETKINKEEQIDFFILINNFFKKFGHFSFLIDQKTNISLLNDIREKLTINFNEKYLENRFNINFDIFFYNIISCFFINCFQSHKDLLSLWDAMLIFSNLGYLKEFLVSACVTFFWIKKSNVDKCQNLNCLHQVFNEPLEKGCMFTKQVINLFKEMFGITSLKLIIK